MGTFFKKLSLGTLLLVGVSALLLWSDWESRVTTTRPVPLSNQPALFFPLPYAQEGVFYRLAIVYLTPDLAAEATLAGLLRGLKDWGFIEDKNLEVARLDAEGDLEQIPQLLEEATQNNADIVVSQIPWNSWNQWAKLQEKPVFLIQTLAATTAKDHASSSQEEEVFCAGVQALLPLDTTWSFFQETFPQLERLGVLYSQENLQAERVLAYLKKQAQASSIQIMASAIDHPTHAEATAQALIEKKIDALYLIGGPYVGSLLEPILKRTELAQVPLIVDAPEQALTPGVLAGIGIHHYQIARAAARPLAEILLASHEEKPLTWLSPPPFSSEQVVLHFETADQLNLVFPPTVLIRHDDQLIPSP